MKLQLVKSKYTNNGRIAIGTLCVTNAGIEPYSNITVNLVDETIPLDTEEIAYGFVDTNNWPEAEEFIKKFNLGEATMFEGHSGYCTYPLYRFDKKLVEESYRTNRVMQF